MKSNKKIAKKISIILVVCALTIGMCFALTACNDKDKRDTITMYTEAGFAPYEFVSSNSSIVGVDVAIMSQVAENLGMKLAVKNVSFDNIPQFVKEGGGVNVGAAGMSITDERKEQVDFTSVYASSTVVIVSKTGISGVAGLAGKKVGAQTGTSGDLIIGEAKTDAGYSYTVEEDGVEKTVTVKAPGATVTSIKSYATLYSYLKAGTIDAILMDKLPAESLLATSGAGEMQIVAATDLIAEDFGIAVKKGDTATMTAINSVITAWLANGDMQKYTDYYTALDAYEKGTESKPVAPVGLKLSWNC